jgi:hypothetical protein
MSITVTWMNSYIYNHSENRNIVECKPEKRVHRLFLQKQKLLKFVNHDKKIYIQYPKEAPTTELST